MTADHPPSVEAGYGLSGDLPKIILRLYVTGTTPHSVRAIANIKAICEKSLKGRYALEVIDIYQHPKMAKEDEIIAAPTLVRRSPMPLRRLVGDMSNMAHVLRGLELPVPELAG